MYYLKGILKQSSNSDGITRCRAARHIDMSFYTTTAIFHAYCDAHSHMCVSIYKHRRDTIKDRHSCGSSRINLVNVIIHDLINTRFFFKIVILVLSSKFDYQQRW